MQDTAMFATSCKSLDGLQLPVKLCSDIGTVLLAAVIAGPFSVVCCRRDSCYSFLAAFDRGCYICPVLRHLPCAHILLLLVRIYMSTQLMIIAALVHVSTSKAAQLLLLL
jgi:hypothetical protein